MKTTGFRTRQRGIVLITALLLLLVMTLIGVSTIQTTTLEEKMTGNLKDSNVAFQAAESALRAAEAWLRARSPANPLPNPSPDGTTGIWEFDKADPDPTNSLAWWDERDERGSGWWTNETALNASRSNSTPYPPDNSSASFAGLLTADPDQRPRYLIEWQGRDTDHLGAGDYADPNLGKDLHRITAYAQGSTGGTEVLLQSFFVWRYVR